MGKLDSEDTEVEGSKLGIKAHMDRDASMIEGVRQS